MQTNYTNIDIQAPAQENIAESQPSDKVADAASKILLFSSIMTNTNTQDTALIFSSVISLYAGILLIKSAYLEAEEQQPSPGEITTANKLKIIGTTGNLVFSIILFIALLIEVYLRRQGTLGTQSPIAGTAGSLLI